MWWIKSKKLLFKRSKSCSVYPDIVIAVFIQDSYAETLMYTPLPLQPTPLLTIPAR